jgi:hypothetical protein
VDDKDGIITVVKTGIVDKDIIGNYILTYTATDIANNESKITRTINVIEIPKIDIIAPVINLIGENIITLNLNTVYVDAGATTIDDVDGVVVVSKIGDVNTSTVGTYILTYTATDIAKNTSTLTRTVNVVNNIPVASTTATLSLPNIGANAGDGLDPNRGRQNLTPFTFEVIYTDSNNNSPKNVKLHIKNILNGIYLPDVILNKITLGSDILSDGNFTNGELYTISKTYEKSDYSYSFSADDKNGNFTKIEENDTLRFSSIVSTYIYIPKTSFGVNNGDGLDWQVWSFNGSNIYDWTDTYSNNYLREQFKIQTYPGGFWCSNCLQRGIFNHDPQKGFEMTDRTITTLENTPQNSMNGKTYNIVIQWDSTGYTYTISHDSILDSTGHTDVLNMNNNLWVGWDGSMNNFQSFSNGIWDGVVYFSPMERTGGSNMTTKPYPVYDPSAFQTPPPTPDPIPDPIPILSSEKLITAFNFESLMQSVNGVIDNSNHTIQLTVPYETTVSALIPSITISNKSSILPIKTEAQNFTNPVAYTVKAEDGSTLDYIVTVIISPNPNPNPEPDPDPIVPNNEAPVISSHTLNGNQSGVTINPLINNLAIILNSNKNVNWMSIKIENESDIGLYKMFQSGVGCVDGTNVCTKIWDGILSSGGLLVNGNYKIKVHIKDTTNKEYDDYLSSVITVNTN